MQSENPISPSVNPKSDKKLAAWLFLIGLAIALLWQPFFRFIYPIKNDSLVLIGSLALLFWFCALVLWFRAGKPGIRASLLFFSSLMIFMFILLEIICRLWIWGPTGLNPAKMANLHEYTYNAVLEKVEDPQIRFQNKPGFHHQYTNATVDISDQGLRDRHYRQSKPDNTFRIACIGDSFTFGLGVEQIDFYPALLTELCKADSSDTNYECMNFGVISYSLDQYLATIQKKAMAFHPDLVIVGFCSNDVSPVDSMVVQEKCELIYPYQYFHAFKCYSIQLVKRALYPILVKSRYYDVDSPEKVSLLQNAFHDFQQLSQDTGIPIVFFYLSHYPVDAQGVQTIADEKNIPFHDLSQFFTGQNPMQFCISRVDPHPNALAHQIYANQMFRYLKDNYLLAQ